MTAVRARIRVGPLTLLIRRRAVVVSLVLLVLLAVALVLAVSLGKPYVAPGDVLRSLSGAGTPYDVVVQRLRLPRAVLAVAVGALFGVAGALIQSVARNSLASPDIIGITQGAGLAATIALTSGAAAAVIAPSALAGGLLAAAAVLALGARHGLAAQRFVLAGVAVAIALRALTEIVMLTAEPIDGMRAHIWLVGTLAGRGWTETLWLAGTLVVLLPVLFWAGWALRTSALDDDTARGLGTRPVARRVGLAARRRAARRDGHRPGRRRRLRRAGRAAGGPPAGPRRTPAAGRRRAAPAPCWWCWPTWSAGWLFAPTQLPAGVVTAAIGGPYLLFLLVRRTS